MQLKSTSAILIMCLITHFSLYSQNTSIEKICTHNTFDFPENTYFSDLDGTFHPFTGTWEYSSGNHVFRVVLSKLEHIYDPTYKQYEDVMVGNYSYSMDGGNTFVTNTMAGNVSSNPDDYPMFALCVEDNKLDFIFRDVAYNKGGCRAIFENLNTSPQTLRMTLKNPQELMPRFEGQPPIPAGFSIPSDVILTKQ